MINNRKQIRICIVDFHITSLFFPQMEVPHGGAEVQLFLLSKAFSNNKNLDVNIIAGDYNLKQRKTKKYKNIKVHIIIPLNRNAIIPIKKYILLLLKLIKLKPDIIIGRTSTPKTGIIAFYCKIFKKKFVYSIAHDHDVNGVSAKGILGKLYKFGLTRASYIIAQNLNQIKILEKWQNRKFFNISVIKSGYHITPLNLGMKNTVLWAARAIRWKRPEIYLKIADFFPNQTFIMICNMGKNIEYWKEIKEKACKIPNLTFIPFVLFEKINEYFKHAKVFINTSIYEGFPNTFIQAAKNKTPILSLNVNPDKFLTKYECGFVCDNKFKKMVNNLEILLTNQDLYNKFSENAFKYVKEQHNINKISKKWIDLLIELCKSP